MEAEVSALKIAFSTNNEWFEWSTIVVLAGLVFELVVLLVFHKTASWRETSVLIAGTLIIAIGVAGEWHFGSKASAAALRLQAISDERVATLATRTEELRSANLKQAEKVEEISKATADATERAARAELALAKFRAPRTLTPEGQVKIAAEMRSFSRTPFVLGVFQELEAITLLEQISGALTSAGWPEQEWKSGGDVVLSRQGHPNAGYTFVIGLYVQADATHTADFGPIVVALAKLLSDVGIEAKAEVGRMGPNTNKDHIKILIGQKPR
jgi:hypothetical protein